MAIDNTPPRLKLIVTIAVITVVTLVSLDFVFKSYYAMMTDEAQREKGAPTKDKDEQRKAEQTALSGAQLPIDQAMAQLAKGTRSELITPQPSDDLAPMTGWSKLPKPAPVAHAHVDGPPATGDAGVVSGDGGVLATGDGGTHAMTGDAGAGAHAAAAHGADAGTAHAPAPHAPAPTNAPAPTHAAPTNPAPPPAPPPN